MFLLCKGTDFRGNVKHRFSIWTQIDGSLPQIGTIWVFRKFLAILPDFYPLNEVFAYCTVKFIPLGANGFNKREEKNGRARGQNKSQGHGQKDMKKYILVTWPESQMLMEHPRFSECLFVDYLEGHDDPGSSAYMCPEDLYKEIFEA